MSISAANATSFVRSLIGESSAKYWTDAEISLYLQFGMTKVLAEFFPFLWEKNKTFEDLGTVANTPDADPPGDYYKISYIQVKETGEHLRYISDDEYWKYSDYENGSPIGWTWKEGKICWIPTPSETDDDYARIWYMKSLDEITDFPDGCRALASVEAAILARTKNEDVTTDLFVTQKAFKQAALAEVTITNLGEPGFFADYRDEERLA